MDSIQLAVLLSIYKIHLEAAVAKIRENLPEELKEISTNLLGIPEEVCPILDPLYQVIGLLDESIFDLKGGA